jgi:hypothetical protein
MNVYAKAVHEVAASMRVLLYKPGTDGVARPLVTSANMSANSAIPVLSERGYR